MAISYRICLMALLAGFVFAAQAGMGATLAKGQISYHGQNGYHPPAQSCPVDTSVPECYRADHGTSCTTVDDDHGARVRNGICSPVGYPDENGDVPCQCVWPY